MLLPPFCYRNGLMWMDEENGFYVGGGGAWNGGGNKIDSGALYRYADGGPEAADISCAYL